MFHGGSRGIVMTSGEGQIYMVLISIQSIRKLGCTLPIEIMYLGEEDLGAEFQQMLLALPGGGRGG